MVWLGTAVGVVTNWSDGQVVATVAAGSTSGNAQILQNGVWSNALPFPIDSLQIANVTPNSGAAGTVVTITGGGFGNSQGSGSVSFGGAAASIVGWSDAQVMASVPSNAVTGVVKVEQNEVWSNAVGFTVPPTLGGEPQLMLVPTVISMVVGDTRSIQAWNSTSQQPVSGLTWTSSNTAIITLSTDDPPIITAVAVGAATITAGSASANVTVYPGPTLPTGTQIWSNLGDGSGVSKIMPAVPSSTGVADVFALQRSGNVQAIRSDGTLGWTADVSTATSLTPDFLGGLVVTNMNASPATVQELNGMTGTANQPYPYISPNSPPILVHTDGTIFTVDNNAIVGINPSTGQQSFTPVPLEMRVAQRTVPPAGFLQANLLQAAGGNVAASGTSLNLPDDPWSLRLVPTSDNGEKGVPYRTIIYTLTKLDGASKPTGKWYVTEHQNNHNVTSDNTGMSGGIDVNSFPDGVGCQFMCPSLPIQSLQTFTISQGSGICAQPSYGNAQNTSCKSSSGTIVVHDPQWLDYGTLGIYIGINEVRVNGQLRWPGVSY
jgi:hypothetical protein